jgi:hypothetical protein
MYMSLTTKYIFASYPVSTGVRLIYLPYFLTHICKSKGCYCIALPLGQPATHFLASAEPLGRPAAHFLPSVRPLGQPDGHFLPSVPPLGAPSACILPAERPAGLPNTHFTPYYFLITIY